MMLNLHQNIMQIFPERNNAENLCTYGVIKVRALKCTNVQLGHISYPVLFTICFNYQFASILHVSLHSNNFASHIYSYLKQIIIFIIITKMQNRYQDSYFKQMIIKILHGIFIFSKSLKIWSNQNYEKYPNNLYKYAYIN